MAPTTTRSAIARRGVAAAGAGANLPVTAAAGLAAESPALGEKPELEVASQAQGRLPTDTPFFSPIPLDLVVRTQTLPCIRCTFLAALLVLLVFISFYLPVLPSFTLPRIPIPRIFSAANNNERPLPPLPSSPTSPDRQLVLRDQSVTIYRRDKKDSYRDRFRKEPKDHYRERDVYAKESDHGRSPRKARRLLTGFRDSSKPDVYDEELIRSPQRSGDRGRSPGGPGRRVRSRSNGFWRPPSHDALGAMRLAVRNTPFSERDDDDDDDDLDHDMDNQNDILQRAIRTRLPTGSMSPDKVRSRSPDGNRSGTLRLEAPTPPVLERILESPPPTDNYIRFAVRAEVQQRTEPIETAVAFIRKRYAALTASWTSTVFSVLLALFSISLFKTLVQAPAPRPVGDLVKVAGIARSFEPLIYYSEHAITQVHDLQATSVAVWDLGETVRTSGMRDASLIVADLDALSGAMKTLATEMTKFFAVVDGDIDG
ncbi:hypothetical protein TARUN_10475, partial [Trichoderma arundinaceum]